MFSPILGPLDPFGSILLPLLALVVIQVLVLVLCIAMPHLKHLDDESRAEWEDLSQYLEAYMAYCRRCTFIKTVPLPYPQWKLTLSDGLDKELDT